MSNADIKRMYDNHPMLTLKELSAITGLTVAALKRLLLSWYAHVWNDELDANGEYYEGTPPDWTRVPCGY